MIAQVRAAFLSSLVALGVSACCVLPILFLLMGLGGSWLVVFGKIAALGYVVLGISSAMIALAWITAYRYGRAASLWRWQAASTAMVAVAWLIVLNESRINDAIKTLM